MVHAYYSRWAAYSVVAAAATPLASLTGRARASTSMTCSVSSLCGGSVTSLRCSANAGRIHFAAESGAGSSQLLCGGPSRRFLRDGSVQFLSLSRNQRVPARDKRRFRRLVPDVSCLDLPLLPFRLHEVLVPTESKTLHLYEARYLSLLEKSLNKTSKLFVHFVLDPIDMPGSPDGTSFAARYGCLVFIENVERLEVGALVSIRGICRVRIANFVQAEPYLTGVVIPVKDEVSEETTDVRSRMVEVKEALQSLNSLEIKLKAPKEAPLQTLTANSLKWAEKRPSLDCDEAFIITTEECISFAAYQTVSGASQSETLKLQNAKLRAVDVKNTLERLDESMKMVTENISIIAAKLAIQSLDIQ